MRGVWGAAGRRQRAKQPHQTVSPERGGRGETFGKISPLPPLGKTLHRAPTTHNLQSTTNLMSVAPPGSVGSVEVSWGQLTPTAQLTQLTQLTQVVQTRSADPQILGQLTQLTQLVFSIGVLNFRTRCADCCVVCCCWQASRPAGNSVPQSVSV